MNAGLNKLLNHNELRNLAAKAGLGEKAVGRVLGSIKVRVKRSVVQKQNFDVLTKEKPKESVLELGLLLVAGEVFLRSGKERLISVLAQSVSDYAKACPVVISWIGRGDFDPSKLPERVTRARLLHACRSAGRLRASLMRELSKG